MKHEKPPSLPPAAFPLLPSSGMSTYFTTLLSLLLFPTPSESLRIPLSVPTVPTSNFECITGPPPKPSSPPAHPYIPSSLRSDGDITITGTWAMGPRRHAYLCRLPVF